MINMMLQKRTTLNKLLHNSGLKLIIFSFYSNISRFSDYFDKYRISELWEIFWDNMFYIFQ